ncbi:MAG: TolC family protein [Candidatus Paceibacterota bacterium]
MAPRPLAGGLSQADAPERDLETTLTELLATSPELRAARARVDRARAQLQRQRVQPIPNLTTQLAVAHDNASGDDIANLQFGLPIPMFNRNQGAIRLAIGEYRRAVSEVRRIELALRTRLAAAFRDYRQTQNQVQQHRDEILPTAKENLDLTEQGYRVGEFNLIRVLTARQSYFESSLAYVRSQVALRQVDVKIAGLLLTGGLDGVPDVTGSNLRGIGLRNQALGGQ